MMRVTIEIVPGGDESRARTISEINIANISNLAATSDYRVEVINWKSSSSVHVADTFHINDHKREDGAYELARRVFTAIVEPGQRAEEDFIWQVKQEGLVDERH